MDIRFQNECFLTFVTQKWFLHGMCLFVNVQDYPDCINVVTEMTIERLGFGTVFFVEREDRKWRRHWGGPGWDIIWQRGSAADRTFWKLNRNIGRKSRVFVAFWTGIRKSFLLDRNKSFQEQKTKNANRNLFRI